MSVTRAAQVGLGVTGIVLGIVAYRMQIDSLGPYTTPARSLAIVGVGWSFLVAGLVAWSRRSGNRIGPLMIAAGLRAPPASAAVQPRPGRLHRLLRARRARLRARGALACSPIRPGASPTGTSVRWSRSATRRARVPARDPPRLRRDAAAPSSSPTPRESVAASWRAPTWLARRSRRRTSSSFYGVLATLFIALIVRRLVRATPRARRILAPLLLAAIAIALRAVFECVFTFVDRPLAYEYLFWWQIMRLHRAPASRCSSACSVRAWLGPRRRARRPPRADPGRRDPGRARAGARRPTLELGVLAARARRLRRRRRSDALDFRRTARHAR